MAKKQGYDNESITMLKGPDKVRKRPAVIFGSDGPDGCAHSIFEVISNSIDEARAGYGNKIVVTRYQDHSVEVEDSVVDVLWISTRMRTGITGNWCTVNCMPAENITQMMITTPILLD